jgi:sulfonate transport system permease protein
LAAIENVSPTIQNFARTLGASRLRVYRTVVLPAIVPEVAGGIRVVIGIAWALLIGGELLGAQSGLGRILSLAAQFADTGRMIVIVALVILYTVLIDAVARRIVGRLTRWAPGDAGRVA